MIDFGNNSQKGSFASPMSSVLEAVYDWVER